MDMEFFPNLPIGRFRDADVWAVEMEQQGWHGVCASDHLDAPTRVTTYVEALQIVRSLLHTGVCVFRCALPGGHIRTISDSGRPHATAIDRIRGRPTRHSRGNAGQRLHGPLHGAPG